MKNQTRANILIFLAFKMFLPFTMLKFPHVRKQEVGAITAG
jgi:hypothetical protein